MQAFLLEEWLHTRGVKGGTPGASRVLVSSLGRGCWGPAVTGWPQAKMPLVLPALSCLSPGAARESRDGLSTCRVRLRVRAA